MSTTPALAEKQKLKSYQASTCRVCNHDKLIKVLDLGPHPLANSFLKNPHDPEEVYPLDVYLCETCGHVQLGTIVDRESIFSDYIYYSAPNPTLSSHFRNYAEDVKERVPAWKKNLIVEIGSNDGLLLREFDSGTDNILGVDPAQNIAAPVPTLREFFSASTAKRIRLQKKQKAIVIMANNVLAHTTHLRNAVQAMANLLDDNGMIIIEAPWLGDMFENNAYDIIYHEHLSYFSITTLIHLFNQFGLVMFDLQFHPVQGNSFRAFFKKNRQAGLSAFAAETARAEREAGWTGAAAYKILEKRIAQSKNSLLSKLESLKAQGKSVAGYGAPAKGNTIINYTGCGKYLDCLIDGMPSKIGFHAPGSRLQVKRREEINPDAFVMFAWTYKPHILEKEKTFKGEWIIPNEV